MFLSVMWSIKIERLLFLKFLKILAFFDSYFWPFNKSEEIIKVIFVISAIIPSIWNVFFKFCWHDEKLTDDCSKYVLFKILLKIQFLFLVWISVQRLVMDHLLTTFISTKKKPTRPFYYIMRAAKLQDATGHHIQLKLEGKNYISFWFV